MRLVPTKLNKALGPGIGGVSLNLHLNYSPPPPTPSLKPNITHPTTITTPNLLVRRHTPTELKEKLEKGICYSCDQKYGENHHCHCKLLHLLGTYDVEEPVINEKETTNQT